MIWIVWVIAGIAGASLLGPPRAWSRVDPTVNRGHYRAASTEYRTWTSSPRRDKPGACTFTVFALVTRERLMRLRINGAEQLLDWSWSWETELPEGTRGEGLVVEYIDPVTGVVEARHEMSEACWALETAPR